MNNWGKIENNRLIPTPHSCSPFRMDHSHYNNLSNLEVFIHAPSIYGQARAHEVKYIVGIYRQACCVIDTPSLHMLLMLCA